MNTTTHYDILEVDYAATSEQIKSAYRRLMLKYHPDKNNGDRGTTDLLLKVKEAYAVLKDQQKKEQYDFVNQHKFRHASADQHNDYSNFANDSFGRADRFRRGGYVHTKTQNDILIEQEFTLEEVAVGAKAKFLQYSRKQICDICHGHDYKNCKECSSTGFITVPHTTIADFPPGSDSRYTWTMKGLGNESLEGGPTGDLIIKAVIKPSPLFRPVYTSSLDIEYKLKIDLIDLLITDKFEVPTLYGESQTITVTIDDIVAGKDYVISDKGLPMWNKVAVKGDMIVNVVLVTAKVKDKKKTITKRLLEHLKKMYDKNSD